MKDEKTILAYTLVILIAASLAAHQYPLLGKENTIAGYAVKEENKEVQEELKVPFPIESLGYVILIILLLAGIYLMILIEKFKNKVIKKQEHARRR
ncbi:MAG: hypothetical protein AABX86_02835 [Nanoarchaeota archaeon]